MTKAKRSSKALTAAEQRVKKRWDLTDAGAREAIRKGYVLDIGLGKRQADEALSILDEVAGEMQAKLAAGSAREGRKHLQAGRKKEALAHFSRAIRYAELKPAQNPWKFRLERALLYAQLGQTAKMKADLRAALKCAPATWPPLKRVLRMLTS